MISSNGKPCKNVGLAVLQGELHIIARGNKIFVAGAGGFLFRFGRVVKLELFVLCESLALFIMLSGNFSSLPVLTDTAVISCFVPFSSVTQKVSLLSDFSPTTFSSGTGVAVGSAVAWGLRWETVWLLRKKSSPQRSSRRKARAPRRRTPTRPFSFYCTWGKFPFRFRVCR